MKAKFFLCMRPPVIETDDEDCIKLPPTATVAGKTSGRRKRVVPEKYIRQLSIKSKDNITDGKPGNQVHKDSQKASETTSPVSEARILKSVCLKKVSMVSSDEVINDGVKSNSGGYIMVSSLFFTMLFGKIVGIVCTMIVVCSLYSHRKDDGREVRVSEKMVVKWPEKGSPEEYKKRVIMAGLLERKSHYR